MVYLTTCLGIFNYMSRQMYHTDTWGRNNVHQSVKVWKIISSWYVCQLQPQETEDYHLFTEKAAEITRRNNGSQFSQAEIWRNAPLLRFIGQFFPHFFFTLLISQGHHVVVGPPKEKRSGQIDSNFKTWIKRAFLLHLGHLPCRLLFKEEGLWSLKVAGIFGRDSLY